MRVTFVYPGIGICGFKNSDYPTDGERNWISHGIASVATAISDQVDVDLIDLRDLNNWDEFRKQLEVADALARLRDHGLLAGDGRQRQAGAHHLAAPLPIRTVDDDHAL